MQRCAGDAGAEFLNRLHQLTGAGIAASPRLVGHADLGGDWQLDTTIGQVSPQHLISPAFAAGYRAVLPGTNNFANAQNWSLTNNTGTTVGATHEIGEPSTTPMLAGYLSLISKP
ncbi:MAG: DUF4347 domain-containing protein [Leptolyngbyaceae cyanobacterium SM2_5_2]|nr:DUF4347 domain-containing protein [Leptolyngbyaceae cyanobacterium SM2_5_2]